MCTLVYSYMELECYLFAVTQSNKVYLYSTYCIKASDYNVLYKEKNNTK